MTTLWSTILVATAPTAAAAAAAATTSAPVRLAACPTDLAVDASGAVHLLTRTQARGRWMARESVISPAGVTTPGFVVSRSWKRPNAVRSVLTRDGIAVAYETGRRPFSGRPGVAFAARAAAHPEVSVATVGPGGTSAPQVVSDPRRSAELFRITSRGGTTVVQFHQSVPGTLWLQDWIAVRPAGAPRFDKAVPLQTSIKDQNTANHVYLGPDGSGVVLSVPFEAKQPISARRMSASGQLGPTFPIGHDPPQDAQATAAVSPTGQIVVAVIDTAPPTSPGQAGLSVAQLDPGASAFSTPKLVGTAGFDTSQVADGLAIAIDDSGHATVTIGREFLDGSRQKYDSGFEVFSGVGDQLVRGPDIDAILSAGDTPVITPTADGSVALTWEGDDYLGGGEDRRAQYISFRAADGTWSTPATVSPPFTWTPDSYALNRASAPLPGGGMALAYSIERAGRTTKCFLVRVTP